MRKAFKFAFDAFCRWYHRRQREYDEKYLWPAICKQADEAGMTIWHARNAFLIHALNNPAWIELGEMETRKYIRLLQMRY